MLTWAIVARPRLGALSGLLVGAGGAWLLLIVRADIACRDFTGPGRSCGSPDLGPWLAIGALMLAAGLALGVATLVRRRPSTP